MKCEDRERKIFDFLYSDQDGLLRRYTIPDYLNADRARDEINDMVSDLNGEIPANITESAFGLVLIATRKYVRRRHGGRGWPPVKIMIAAMDDALKAARTDPVASGDDGSVLELMEKWFARFQSQMPSSGSPARTSALIRRGMLTDEREAKFFGFDLGDEQRKYASGQTAADAEQKLNTRVLAKIWRCSIEDAKIRDNIERGNPVSSSAAEIMDEVVAGIKNF